MLIDTFQTNKNIKDIKIALISDIHYFYPGYNINIFKKIEKQLEKAKPEYICIAGDLINEGNISNINELIEFLNNISNIAPIIYVMGNHEVKMKFESKWIKTIPEILYNGLKKVKNIHILEDSKYIDSNKNICFYGFNPTFEHYERKRETLVSFKNEIKKLNTKLDSNTYNILLLHTPINIYDFIEENPNHNLSKCDIILSGHMHNSCLPHFITRITNKIFKTNKGLISPHGDLFPKYSHGRTYKIKDGIIHQGIYKFSKKTGFHFLNRFYSKQIHIINIKKAS